MGVEMQGNFLYDALQQKTVTLEGKQVLQALRAGEEEHLRIILENYQALPGK